MKEKYLPFNSALKGLECDILLSQHALAAVSSALTRDHVCAAVALPPRLHPLDAQKLFQLALVPSYYSLLLSASRSSQDSYHSLFPYYPQT